LLRNYYSQDGRGRRKTESSARWSGARGVPSDCRVSSRESASRGFSRSDGSTHGRCAWLRIDSGQQRGRTVRTSASIRDRRSTGGGIPGQITGTATVEYDFGLPHDGTDEDLYSLERRPRPEADRHGAAGGALC